MASAKFLTAIALLALVACALAQTADDARQLGEPGSNYCSSLCDEAVKRNSDLSKLTDFCKSECRKCVEEVAKTTPGAKAPLPGPCQTAYKFKEISAVIADYQAGKLSGASKGNH